MELPKVKLTTNELKTARALLKEITSCSFNRLYGSDMLQVEIVDKAAEVIINWNAPNLAEHYWTKFSSLSEDAQGAARGIQANCFNGVDSADYFFVTTTHDLDSLTFSKGAIDSLAAYLVKKALNNDAENIERYTSCNQLAGSKYRPSHRKLAEKILKLDGKIYVANTYIYRNGVLRHSDKEFNTAVAAYKYLHKKMKNYAGTTDATQTIEVYDGVTSTEIYHADTNGGGETTTNAEIQELIDAQISAKEIKAEQVVTVDLSTTEGSMSASAALHEVLCDDNRSFSDTELIKIAYEMVDDIARCDKAGDELVSEGKISAKSQAYSFVEGQLRGAYQIGSNRDRVNILDLMYLAKVTEREYLIQYRENLINDFDFSRNAAAKAAIYALNLAGVKATGKTDYVVDEEEFERSFEMIACIEDYAVDGFAAAEVEIENAKSAEIKEIEREIKYTHKSIFNRKMEVAEWEGGIETLKKLNILCEREFNARLLRKENLRDLTSIAEKIEGNLETIKNREERIADIKRGIEIEEKELAELVNDLAKCKPPKPLTDEEIENAPSVEEIFLKAMEENVIQATSKGKYVLDIYDNYRCQKAYRKFKNLKDAVKIARVMHKELSKVSRHIYAIVGAYTMDIGKYYFRADDWTNFYQIDQYGEEFVKRRETVDAIAELDERTVEEVQNDICSYGDDYGLYKNRASENAEKKSLNWQSVSTKQKEFRKAYLQGNLKVASELFETLKIFYRAYAESRAA